jgi:hypothetical protein
MLSIVSVHGIKILFLQKLEKQILQKNTYKEKSEVALLSRHYTIMAYGGHGHKATHTLYLGM